MSAQYSVDIRTNDSFAIDADTLRAFVHACRKITTTPADVSIKLADGQKLTSHDVDDLLADPALLAHEIVGIEISSLQNDHEDRRYYRLTFGELSTHALKIEAPRNVAIAARSEIEGISNSARLRSSWIHNSWLGGLLPIATLILAALIVVPIVRLTLTSESNNIFFLAATIVYFAIAFFLVYLIHQLYPTLEFNIGRSGRSARARAVIRQTVFTVVILGGIVGFVVNTLHEFRFWR